MLKNGRFVRVSGGAAWIGTNVLRDAEVPLRFQKVLTGGPL
jgi:hypothetical protein